ncbi:MAG: hypothetical protein C0404_10565 [Verrucomicrobia bacterium]|nr:hypothetical protein [Verrucomicrobiota bacterium]
MSGAGCPGRKQQIGNQMTRDRRVVLRMCLAGVSLLAIGIVASGCARKQAVDPAAALSAGWEFCRAGEFGPAVLSFDDARRATGTNDPLHIKALYGLASTWNLRRPGEDTEKAGRIYQQVVDMAPASDLAAWSMLAQARMKHLVPVGQEPDYPAVREAYQRVIDRFPNHLAGEEAFVYQQASLVASLKDEDARTALANIDRFLQEHPASRLVSALWGLTANCRETLRQPREQLDAAIKAFETRPVDPTNPKEENTWAYWRIATLAEFEVGDFATARTFYGRFVAEYPNDDRTYGAKMALARMDALEARLREEERHD